MLGAASLGKECSFVFARGSLIVYVPSYFHCFYNGGHLHRPTLSRGLYYHLRLLAVVGGSRRYEAASARRHLWHAVALRRYFSFTGCEVFLCGSQLGGVSRLLYRYRGVSAFCVSCRPIGVQVEEGLVRLGTLVNDFNKGVSSKLASRCGAIQRLDSPNRFLPSSLYRNDSSRRAMQGVYPSVRDAVRRLLLTRSRFGGPISPRRYDYHVQTSTYRAYYREGGFLGVSVRAALGLGFVRRGLHHLVRRVSFVVQGVKVVSERKGPQLPRPLRLRGVVRLCHLRSRPSFVVTVLSLSRGVRSRVCLHRYAWARGVLHFRRCRPCVAMLSRLCLCFMCGGALYTCFGSFFFDFRCEDFRFFQGFFSLSSLPSGGWQLPQLCLFFHGAIRAQGLVRDYVGFLYGVPRNVSNLCGVSHGSQRAFRFLAVR